MAVRLTTLSHGAGCACKVPAGELSELLGRLPRVDGAAVLQGFEGFDDAAVVRVADDLAVVQSVDFFTPIVDDPATFGAIAAANALSDLYATGARPAFALALAAWPRSLELDGLAEVMAGGAAKAAEAGAPIVGGHTIDDPEPKYGLAVTGIGRPDELWRNAGGRPGDELWLTKPLGTGVISTALKHEAAPEDAVSAAVASMTRLNRDAAEAARAAGPSAVTDVTGFGLAGHAHELAQASGLTAVLRVSDLPWLPHVRELAEAGHVAGGSRRNRGDADAYATFAPGLDAVTRLLACDAQTSGGLLVALAPERREAFTDAAARLDVPAVAVGVLERGEAGAVLVR
jgi:selenide,water dikinase